MKVIRLNGRNGRHGCRGVVRPAWCTRIAVGLESSPGGIADLVQVELELVRHTPTYSPPVASRPSPISA